MDTKEFNALNDCYNYFKVREASLQHSKKTFLREWVYAGDVQILEPPSLVLVKFSQARGFGFTLMIRGTPLATYFGDLL